MADESRPKSFPVFTAWAILGPVLVLGVGILATVAMPQIENGIYHGPLLTPVGIALMVACAVAVACSVAAFLRKERVALLSVITALPALLLLGKVLAERLHL
jgi:hypothetical protein